MIVSIVVSLLFHFKVVLAETTGKLNGDLRIVGGTDAAELPTLAFSAGSKLCGGTLIYPEYVLTYDKQEMTHRYFICSHCTCSACSLHPKIHRRLQRTVDSGALQRCVH